MCLHFFLTHGRMQNSFRGTFITGKFLAKITSNLCSLLCCFPHLHLNTDYGTVCQLLCGVHDDVTLLTFRARLKAALFNTYFLLAQRFWGVAKEGRYINVLYNNNNVPGMLPHGLVAYVSIILHEHFLT